MDTENIWFSDRVNEEGDAAFMMNGALKLWRMLNGNQAKETVKELRDWIDVATGVLIQNGGKFCKISKLGGVAKLHWQICLDFQITKTEHIRSEFTDVEAPDIQGI
ncbi:hypothetical protein FQR65_LT18421 [Abscondita terminalis]|nr:hypothetical protein FQR65_LT18421 [Abscondita terminalis]